MRVCEVYLQINVLIFAWPGEGGILQKKNRLSTVHLFMAGVKQQLQKAQSSVQQPCCSPAAAAAVPSDSDWR